MYSQPNNSGPKLFATRITSGQAFVSAVYSTVQFNSILFDTNSYWDGVNFRYKPLVAGTYRTSCGLYVTGTSVSTLAATISKNGIQGGSGVAILETSNNSVATQQGVCSGSALVTMNGTTDTLEVDVFATVTGSPVINFVRNATFFTVEYVGP